MSSDYLDSNSMFEVLVNDEGQHSLWPAHKNLPVGWRNTGFSGSPEKCIEHVDKVWTDITPLSISDRVKKASG